MTASLAEIQADAGAFKRYTDRMLAAMGQSFVGIFIPASAWSNAALAMITAADASEDQSTTGRQKAANGALRAALDNTGEGSRVTDAQCARAVEAVLKADGAWRVAHKARDM